MERNSPWSRDPESGKAVKRIPSVPPIIDFCERRDNAGLARPPLYPRQKTLLKLIFLETEEFTAYDVDVINYWAENFYRGAPDRIGLPPDIWDRIAYCKRTGYDHFREVIFIGGRRGGKGHIGAIIGARQIYRLLQMNSPQLYYGLDPNKELVAHAVATSFRQAKEVFFADLANTIIDAPCFSGGRIAHATGAEISFRTKADEDRIAMLFARGEWIDRNIASIKAKAVTSNARAGRGEASFLQVYDEFAHMISSTGSAQAAEEVYGALTPSLDQMRTLDPKSGLLVQDGMIYVPTSPYSKVGQAYTLYEEGLSIVGPDDLDEESDLELGDPLNPDVLVIQLASWDPYIGWDDLEATDGHTFIQPLQVYDQLAKRIERRDPARFKVERRAQWADVEDAYLMEHVVDAIFSDFVVNDKERHLGAVSQGILAFEYRGHADPSESQHNFAMCIAHTETFEDGFLGKAAHVVVDLIHVWKPEDYDDHMIPYDQIADQIAQTILRFPTMSVFTFDQYGGFATAALMQKQVKRAGSKTRVYQVKLNQNTRDEKYEKLKTALGLGWVHSYRDTYGGEGGSLLEQELKFLQKVRGHVRKQDIGPVTTDDLADAFASVVSELLSDQIDRLERREALAEARIMAGNPGGYHSGNVDPDQQADQTMTRGTGGVRERLGQFSQDAGYRRRGY